jgi:aryl-alcohol dehydrogenase-like predicted oxidoreductase
MKRRTFLKTVGTAAGGIAAGIRPLFADPADPSRQLIPHASGLPRRILGRTGQAVSIIGFPGLALAKIKQPEANQALRSAFDKGINHFDVAPAYGDAEIKMGPAMEGLPRDKIFLSCKTKARDAAGVMKELERSLQRLQTDHFELYQLHFMSTAAEVKQVFGPAGAIEALLKAREQGKVRWLGFSAHTKEAALDCLRQFKFETVMYPINFIEHFTHQFDPEVLALARQVGTAAIAIKPISAGSWKPGEAKTRNNYWYRALEEQAEINQAYRFTLSLDPVVTALPISFVDLTEKSIVAGVDYRPATNADLEALRTLAGKYLPLFPRKPSYLGAAGPHTPYYAHT